MSPFVTGIVAAKQCQDTIFPPPFDEDEAQTNPVMDADVEQVNV
jgi:hypothetical protein